MSRMPREYLLHMRDELEYLSEGKAGLTRDQFLQDATFKRAFVRSIEILGEASKRVPAAFKERYPELNWKAIAGMRDRLIHGYFGIDYDIVWDVVENKVPLLREQIQEILQQEDGGALI